MKSKIRIAIISSIISVSTASLQAQIKFGAQAHGALNKSSFVIEGESPDKEWKLGYGIGAFAEIPIMNSLSLRPSLNYLQKGGKMNHDFSVEGIPGKQKAEIKLEYLEMPILLIYNIGKESSKYYVGAGPSFGYGISGKAETNLIVEGSSETVYYKPFTDIEDGGLGFKKFDFSLNAVIGMRVLERGMIQLGYLHGLSNIENTDEYKDNKFKNRSVMVTLGYCFY